jgi:class 3 adenylate cyclase/TolB-like protein/tetratricopeptide (TPR) repeat protein
MSEPVTPAPNWPELHRSRRAIVVVDVVESVRLMQQHEDEHIDRWRRFVDEVRSDVLPAHGGRLVKSLGDGMLLEFADAPSALAGALALQRRIERYNDGCDEDAVISLRAGAHVADVVIAELDVYGSGVNLASRLATLARPSEIIVSPELRDQCLDGVDATFEDLGEAFVKHLGEPVHAIRVHPRDEGPASHAVAHTSWRPDDLSVRLPSIAVMPFDAHADSLLLGELIADGIVAQLATSSVLRVISRTSTSALAQRRLTSGEIGTLLDADYLLCGRVVGIGSVTIVSVELLRAAAGDILWADRYTTSVPELLQRDDPVTRELALQTVTKITEQELRFVSNVPLPSLGDYSLQLAGATMMHRSTRREFDRAGELLGHLVERHPRAAHPHALLAQWHVLRVTRALATDLNDEARRALDHTRRALDCEAESALAYAVEGFVYCHVLRDLDAAQSRLDRALEIKPNEPLAWLFQCVVQGFRGDGEEAWNSAQRAVALSPLDPMRAYFDGLAASAALASGHLPPAIELAERSLLLNRNHLPTLRALTIALVESGYMQRAGEMAARVLALDPDFTIREYQARTPRGASLETRERYARALRAAGIPP